jgi:tRNA A37 threonylcarbamoyladenosine synthetase subunit TsaC/SUA5/YrdC
MLGDVVAVIVDGGASLGGEASTIVDVTVPEGRVLRVGALSVEQLNAAIEEHGVVLTDEG